MADIQTTVDKMAKADLEEVRPTTTPNPLPETSMPAPKIQSIVAKLREIGKYNGYMAIARLEGVPKNWVIAVEKARKAALTKKLVQEEVIG